MAGLYSHNRVASYCISRSKYCGILHQSTDDESKTVITISVTGARFIFNYFRIILLTHESNFMIAHVNYVKRELWRH